MHDASSDVEIVSSTHPISSRPHPNPTRSTDYSLSRASTSVDPSVPRRARTTSTQASNVITLSDGSEDEARPRGLPRSTRTASRVEDDDVVIVAESQDTAQRRTGGSTALGRSASMTTASSSSSSRLLPPRANTLAVIPDFDLEFGSSPPPPHANARLSSPAPPLAANGKGKGKERQPSEMYDDWGRRKQIDRPELDPWNAFLESDSDSGARRKKGGKGKGKAKEPSDGRRKRLLSDEEASGAEEETTKRKSAAKKAPRLSKEDTAAKKTQAAAGKASQAALKKQETLDRQKLREANTLQTSDKLATAAKLTMHISGTAFQALEETSDTEDEGTGRRKGKGKGKKEKPSPWIEITEKARMEKWVCAVERPEFPSRDLGCEGAVRWTRVCDTKWDKSLGIYVPLLDGQRIVVEEDTRMIFLNALDLSRHIIRKTLSTFVSGVQAQLSPHSKLFIMLFGLNSIFKDLERVRQAEYKRDLAMRAGQQPNAVIKPAGIGEDQPNKDELELAIMKMQIESKCMIVTVEKVEEAVEWLEQITVTVGQKPYQRYKQSHGEVLGTGGASQPSGKGLQDTYMKMLTSLKNITPAYAESIASYYPTMRSLLEAYEHCEGGEKGRKEMLRGIEKGRNVNGSATHRAIGAILSANIYRMLSSKDPKMFI
ncbi:Mms4p [Sporobolomyces salmoneus]|uniref:Mms4p n=1 Tax=Sporobolomyces salmoneus TaxID=183962 RepID=UPI003180105A